MARNQVIQRQRTSKDPLLLGNFEETSIRYLKGTLGGKHVPTRDGYGGGTVNHWFQINLKKDAWIITIKDGGWEKWFSLSAYDLNTVPIEGRNIFDKDSITVEEDGSIYNPFVGHIMDTQSIFYNQFAPTRLDKGDSRYYPLSIGSYLLCVSSTLNIPFDYAVGLIIEIADPFPLLLTENYSNLLFEDTATQSDIICDTTPNYDGNDEHQHSLTEWQRAWEREMPSYDKFPEIFATLATRP